MVVAAVRVLVEEGKARMYGETISVVVVVVVDDGWLPVVCVFGLVIVSPGMVVVGGSRGVFSGPRRGDASSSLNNRSDPFVSSIQQTSKTIRALEAYHGYFSPEVYHL